MVQMANLRMMLEDRGNLPPTSKHKRYSEEYWSWTQKDLYQKIWYKFWFCYLAVWLHVNLINAETCCFLIYWVQDRAQGSSHSLPTSPHLITRPTCSQRRLETSCAYWYRLPSKLADHKERNMAPLDMPVSKIWTTLRNTQDISYLNLYAK